MTNARRFLMVEDEYLIAVLIEEYLADFQHQVTLDEALEQAHKGVFHAALLDLQLAGALSYPALSRGDTAAGPDGIRGSATGQMDELAMARIISLASAEPGLTGSPSLCVTLASRRRSAGIIDAVDLEHALREIEADRDDGGHGRILQPVEMRHPNPGSGRGWSMSSSGCSSAATCRSRGWANLHRR